jgi:sugar phosphate isomerase/epimerase
VTYTRREAGKLALAGLALPHMLGRTPVAGVDINGVTVGVITYSFRAIPDAARIVTAMRDMGFTDVELMYDHAEQLAGAPAEAALAAWRASVSMDQFAPVKKRFADAGLTIRVLCFNMTPRLSDQEIDYAFRLATTLGAAAISTTTQVSMARRIAPFADRHRMMVGFHGHDMTSDPNEFATPESFETAMALSRYHGVNLDIGHFVAAGYDPVAYIAQHHDRITNLHIKDRKKNHGATVAFGQGDTPIGPVLQLLKKNAWKIPADIEFEYSGDPLVEVPKCLAYCRDALR